MSAPDPIILLDRGGLRLSLSPQPDPAAIDLLEATLWGTPGGIRYQHLDTRTHLQHLPAPWFLQLHKAQEFLGILALSRRHLQLGPGTDAAYYIRYFSVRESLRRKTDTTTGNTTEARDSLLKRIARDFFDHPATMLQADGQTHALFYAYVTLDNARSRNLCEMMGFQPVRTFTTLAFSRMFPRRSPQVHPAKPTDLPQLQTFLQSTYHNHSFYPHAPLSNTDDFYIYQQDSHILAALKASPVRWRMADMPGWSGKILLKVLPWLPFLNRLINPDKFHFMAVDHIFCAPGHEQAITTLLSHACATHHLYTALFWLDQADPLRTALSKSGSLGLINRLNHVTPISLIVKGATPDQLDHLCAHPAFIPSPDVS